MDKYLLRRYFLFVIAVFVNAFGIAFITKGMLGTSPVTSVNYVLSMFTPVTMGQWTIITNLLYKGACSKGAMRDTGPLRRLYPQGLSSLAEGLLLC